MQYRVKVLSVQAQVESLMLDAANEAEVRRMVEANGGSVLSLAPVSTGWRQSGLQTGFNLLVFNQQLYALLKAGQSIVESITILTSNDKAGRNKAVYAALLHALKQGRQLSDAMTSLPSVFPPLYVAMVQSSESIGNVKAAIQRYTQDQQQMAALRSKLLAAAIYPLILVGVGLLVVAFLMLFVVPRFTTVFEDLGRQQTGITGLLQQWGVLVQTYPALAWTACLLGLVLPPLVLLRPAVRRWLYQRLLTSPWVGERLWVLQLARLYRTLGMLLRSGVHLLAAMKMAEASLSTALQQDLRAAVVGLSQGRKLSRVMVEQHLTTEVAHRLLLAGESSGNLDEMLEHIADFYDQEVAGSLDLIGRLIEPALMVFIGLVIGGIVLTLYVPIFDLANAVK
ncbi:MAG: type II secretion system F family protein [Elusimicrobia bacterium]|nr:MAG: type II secretion system F family protein [Elusimicrobiota bacterium]